MKITEERECCEEQDLRQFNGLIEGRRPLGGFRFCIHCGQIWERQLGDCGLIFPQKIDILTYNCIINEKIFIQNKK